jgi:tRNA(fMet)-specific endonuclease VapC
MRYLLDTNVLSAVVRNAASPAGERIRCAVPGSVATSVIVTAELRFGCRKVNSEKIERRVETVLASLPVVAWESPADLTYAELRATLERRGRTIGQMDMLIAAHALALGAVLVTDNVREFSMVEDLAVENWVTR